MNEQILGFVDHGNDKLTLNGKVHMHDYEFPVDSGASHNIVSQSFVIENGLKCELGRKVQAKMAPILHP